MPRNNGQRKYETMCSSCDQLVGVIYTSFNRQIAGSYAPVPKTSRHMANGRWCPGSQLSVPMSVLIPRAA